MSKLVKKSPGVIAQENRCEVCDTKLTLYPKDFMECPHCHKRVCRQCWDAAWASKDFSAENCAHLAENDGLDPIAFTKKERNLNWDWPRIAAAALLAILAGGLILFLFNLFVF